MFRGVPVCQGGVSGVTGCPEGVPGVFQAVLAGVLWSLSGCSGPVPDFTDTGKRICIMN